MARGRLHGAELARVIPSAVHTCLCVFGFHKCPKRESQTPGYKDGEARSLLERIVCYLKAAGGEPATFCALCALHLQVLHLHVVASGIHMDLLHGNSLFDDDGL